MDFLSVSHSLLLAIGTSLLLTASAPAQQTYCATLGGQLYELDLAGGRLYGICDANNAGCVVELDLTTGAATSLFTTGMNLVGIDGAIGAGIEISKINDGSALRPTGGRAYSPPYCIQSSGKSHQGPGRQPSAAREPQPRCRGQPRRGERCGRRR